MDDPRDLPTMELVAGFDYLHRMVAGRNWIIYPTAVMIRAKSLEKVGKFTAIHCRYSLDMNLYMRIAEYFDIAFVAEALIQVRTHRGQDSEYAFRCSAMGNLAVMGDRMDAVGYLMRSARSDEPRYREWLAERLLHLSLRRSEITQQLFPKLNFNWEEKVDLAREEILSLIPPNTPYILIDEHQLDDGRLKGSIPFTSRDGQYWGPPRSDDAAIAEIERLRDGGVHWLVFAWPAFWWYDYYYLLRDYLQMNYKRIVSSNLLIVFELSEKRSERQTYNSSANRSHFVVPGSLRRCQ